MDKFIIVDDNHRNLSTKGLRFKSFSSDFRLIRYITMLITNHAPNDLKEINILQQQISELVKNGAKHGNNYDKEKSINIWFSITRCGAHIIVEDQGDGFKDIEKWNSFKMLRDRAFRARCFKEMTKYAVWKGENSKPEDGGNSLFAAIEYWDKGVVFSQKGNRVGVRKSFCSIQECSLLREIC